MNSQRVPITRRGKEIGFFEAPLPQEAFATLPNLEGDTLGLGIVVEIDEAPAAALILAGEGAVAQARGKQWCLAISATAL